jgi:flavin-dependent dehydrogenase
MEKYDVVIIGAGPAGSTLAYRLAKIGFSVCIFDREKFPRKKVCAGGLPEDRLCTAVEIK